MVENHYQGKVTLEAGRQKGLRSLVSSENMEVATFRWMMQRWAKT